MNLNELGPAQVKAWRDKREQISFLLGEGVETARRVKPTDLLQAYDQNLLGRDGIVSRNMSNADLWIARNGDPLASVDAAMKALRHAGIIGKVTVEYNKAARVKIDFFGNIVETTGDTAPIAIALAGLECINKKEAALDGTY